ncbi:MAG: cation acetate symporter [Zoogloeaceae bacterium]|jgi:cation/acetate symporter|nr:cation acetate symporter [Zoogloeaceae bacterium]
MSALNPKRAGALFFLAVLWSAPANAADSSLRALLPHTVNQWLITAAFMACVCVALVVARLAAAKARADADNYHLGLSTSSFQNGLAIAGSYFSGASFLGVSALIVTHGYDGMVYAIGFLAGWPIMTLLLAERLRNLGKFTLGDVLAYRLKSTPIRVFAAIGSLVVTLLYLMAQMVGVGQLIRLLFGFEYWMGVAIVGAMMMLYVRLGGIFATTWLTIVKSVLLLVGATVLALAAIWKFGFGLETLSSGTKTLHTAVGRGNPLAPGSLLSDPVSLVSVSLALMCGLAGLPHVLIRFFTAPNPREARMSAFWATAWSGWFYLLSIAIGFGAIGFILGDPVFRSVWRNYEGGDNMASLYLAHAAGGGLFMGTIAAIAFLTILAVMGGLVLAGAASVSHDLYAIVRKKGKPDPARERRISHLAALGLGAAAVALGLATERLNMAILVSLAFSIAASAHFPVLILSLFWKRCTTRGALVGGYAGLLSAMTLTLLSEPVWVGMLRQEAALFPYASPALFSIPAALLGVWLFSVTDKSARAREDRDNFDAQQIRAETGVGGIA